MKKHLRTLALSGAILVAANATAQSPVGTMVQNFTLTDINGNTQDLYSYLDAGKMVVIDVSAAWCNPCWMYHSTGALNSFYNAHGPAGADDAMVLFIEGDPTTGTDCLYAAGPCTGTTSQGDWVTGENYPIIDIPTSAAFTNSGLSIPYYPVMYVICPNRTVIQSGVAGSIGTLSALNSYIGSCPSTTSGLNASLNQYTGTVEAPCGLPATAKVILQNMGTTPLTSCTISGTIGSSTVGPINWTGSLNTYEFEEVNLGSFTISGASTANIAITTSDASASDNALAPFTVSDNASPTAFMTVVVETDYYASETGWNVKNSAGTTMHSVAAGTYPDMTTGVAGTTIQTPVNLTLPTDCYTFTITDAYGDGMCCSYGNGNYKVKYGSTVLITGAPSTATHTQKFSTIGTAGVNEIELMNGVTVFPNPVNNMATASINLASQSDLMINITNSVGEVIASQKQNNAPAGTVKVDLDFSSFANGVYYVKIVAGNQTSISKIVK